MSAFVRLIPFLIIIIVLFALLQGYSAIAYGVHGDYPFAAFYGVMTVAGLALARALWVHRSVLLRKR